MPAFKHSVFAALLAATCFAAPAMAHAESMDFDCQALRVVDRREFINLETFWAEKRDIKPEYRRVTVSDEGKSGSITYGLGEGKPQNWTMPITSLGDKDKNAMDAGTEQPDQWGHRRWIKLFTFPGSKERHELGFMTVIRYPDGTVSGVVGTCKLAPGQEHKLDQEPGEDHGPATPRDPSTSELKDPGQPATPKLRDPGQPKSGPQSWTVPLERRGGNFTLDGKLNDQLSIHWMLDTGATISAIPYDVASKLDAKVVGEHKFKMADGSVITAQVVLIRKLQVGSAYAENIEASVGPTGSPPLLGKNFLDSFTSFEVDNAQSFLVLRK